MRRSRTNGGVWLALIWLVGGCSTAAAEEFSQAKKDSIVKVSQQVFGTFPSGQEVILYTLDNGGGLKVRLCSYGARLVSVETPDRKGQVANVTIGLDSLAAYEQSRAFLGCVAGRYCNRIAKGKFTLDGHTYPLATNNGPNHLHGGLIGFDRRNWTSEREDAQGSVTFRYHSPDGEEGYPGALDVAITYQVTGADEPADGFPNSVIIRYEATTDHPTVVNLTNHAFWNLGGIGSGKILGHELQLMADQYLPIDETSIPTGKPAAVKGTPFDFTSPKTIGERIDQVNRPPHATLGYDHNYVLRGGSGIPLAARLRDPQSGRVMEVFTTEPGMQLYTGNFFKGEAINGGYQQYDAMCLEAQHFPDSPNQPAFPSTRLDPGQIYRQTTIHRFRAE